MEYRRLGKSGLPVSALSYGSWVTFSHQLDVAKALETMTAAYDAGVNFFDNAEVYATGQSETIMGEALEKVGWRRDSYIVSSKVMWGSVEDPKPTQRGLHRKHVFDACHDALRRLRVEYLDLYFCHRPDPAVPMEEIVRMMTELIHQGKVLYWGTSQWSAQQLSEAYGVARQYHLIPPTMEQPQYSMFHREKVELEFAPLYETMGLGTTIWSPLYFGILTGKYNDGIPADSRATLPGYEWVRQTIESEEGQQKIAKVRELSTIAEGLGTSMSRLAIAWCLRNPHVSTVIMGASRVEQVHDNLRALDLLPQLTDDVMAAIEGVLGNKPEAPESD
ncbi:MAG: aldo/keto reductase [Candidatus Promineofilum sp.]|nr:aldo/keto reductase [Promineifilum sp.]